jgi:hypothetical protein
MECPVCGGVAQQIPSSAGRIGVVCWVCGEYDVESAVIASGQLRSLEPEQRRDVLDTAKRSSQPGTRPLIRPYLLD